MSEKQEHQARGPDVRDGKWTARERQHGEPPRPEKIKTKRKTWKKSKSNFLKTRNKRRSKNSILKSLAFQEHA